ncbi:MAG TPA: acyl-CoA dehydrogenase family protein [Paracoccus sp. (in: a-proteobacteria)]|uniref:acyl-CoA dehydrogenase family protein n=1 Tax=Paracoccus sp. TaxID=267 RepID=UPI002C071309|nr:acyl-CoA dehydrogenase family protein [Paracoccus sp. (in: a-proteobacteria)]HWL58961.1 acyl-CoA dehydrogenase family protein [Paracoccus sp. (in: a-proteobacteria)]
MMMDPDTATMLRDAVARHVERHADGRAIRARRGSLPGPRASTPEEMAEQGWLGLALPEEAGGLGLGLPAAALVVEGLAGSFTSDPFIGLYLAGRVLALAGGGEDQLAGLGEGRICTALAWQEAPAEFAAPRPQTRFHEGRLTGRKGWIAGGAGAGFLIVTAQDAAEPVLALVSTEAEGVRVSPGFRADGSPFAGLELEAAPAEVLARGAVAEAALRRALDEGSVLIAAELMGHVDRMMDLTLEHLKTRRQFGRAIGAFQALQHRAADMFVRQRLARAVLDAGITRLADPLDVPALGMQAARLRARLNDTAQLIMRESIQLFGAMGITDENDLSLHVKRCLSLIGWLGNSTEQRRYFMDLAAPRGRWPEGRN